MDTRILALTSKIPIDLSLGDRIRIIEAIRMNMDGADLSIWLRLVNLLHDNGQRLHADIVEEER